MSISAAQIISFMPYDVRLYSTKNGKSSIVKTSGRINLLHDDCTMFSGRKAINNIEGVPVTAYSKAHIWIVDGQGGRIRNGLPDTRPGQYLLLSEENARCAVLSGYRRVIFPKTYTWEKKDGEVLMVITEFGMVCRRK